MELVTIHKSYITSLNSNHETPPLPKLKQMSYTIPPDEPRTRECPACDGEGMNVCSDEDGQFYETCDLCEGTGEVTEEEYLDEIKADDERSNDNE